jgi:uncharacterized ubiquitin-like protein YukD
MRLIFRNFTGSSFNMDIDPENTIAGIKPVVSHALKKRPTSTAFEMLRLRLEYKGHLLRDDKSLRHYGIRENSVIHIGESL